VKEKGPKPTRKCGSISSASSFNLDRSRTPRSPFGAENLLLSSKRSCPVISSKLLAYHPTMISSVSLYRPRFKEYILRRSFWEKALKNIESGKDVIILTTCRRLATDAEKAPDSDRPQSATYSRRRCSTQTSVSPRSSPMRSPTCAIRRQECNFLSDAQ